jgi:hypothetical protein
MKENEEFRQLVAVIGLKGDRLAEALNLTRGGVSQILSGKSGVKENTLNRAREVARQVTEHMLQKSQPLSVRKSASASLELTDRPPGAISLPKKTGRGIPVVSWAKAGDGGNFSDLADQIDEWIGEPVQDPNAYALIIEGDSMEPEFRQGDRVVFLPNSSPQNGDCVVARLGDCGSVYFKLFTRTGKKGEIIKLTSFNPAYPPMEYHSKDFRFIHPMAFSIRRRRH